ncbi:GHKL domain-containing protein, partial [Enterococcus faecalis]|nr:GHKL domain-containing protein [Enterococcus faecalis]
VKLKRSNNLSIISSYQWFTYISLNLISIVSILSLIELTYSAGKIHILTLLSTFGLLFLNVLVFRLLEKEKEYETNKRERALFKQQLEIGLTNIQVLTQSFKTQRAFMHDYKQYLSTIYRLIDYDKGEAKNLISSLNSNLYTSLYRFKTNNTIIDAILNQKFIEAEALGISLDIRAEDLNEIKIDSPILVTVLSNAIDNALEATNKVPFNKIIAIKLEFTHRILVFSVINPVLKTPIIIDNIIKTSKEDKTVHGQGLRNISRALEQCNGDYELNCDGSTFQFTAIFRT